MADATVRGLRRNLPRWRSVSGWGLQIVLAVAFFAAGGQKLLGVERMVALFETIGVGQSFRIMTGALEVTGAALLISPRTARLGALTLAIVMGGAVLTHVLLIGGSALPAFLLLVLTAMLAWLRTSPADS